LKCALSSRIGNAREEHHEELVRISAGRRGAARDERPNFVERANQHFDLQIEAPLDLLHDSLREGLAILRAAREHDVAAGRHVGLPGPIATYTSLSTAI
jgi:hypothetical protein